MSKVNNFDVLKKMSADGKYIMLCPDVLNMTYNRQSDGTRVELGVPGNVIADIFGGKKRAVLLIWDKEQFDATSKELSLLQPEDEKPPSIPPI